MSKKRAKKIFTPSPVIHRFVAEDEQAKAGRKLHKRRLVILGLLVVLAALLWQLLF